MLLVHNLIDTLNHNNGIVDNNTDCKNKSQKRHQVKREAEDKHHTKGTDKRDGHRNNRDYRIPKTDEIAVVVNLIVFAPSRLIINCYNALSGRIAELIKYLFADRVSILI